MKPETGLQAKFGIKTVASGISEVTTENFQLSESKSMILGKTVTLASKIRDLKSFFHS
jgi:hypothetical protein